MSEWMKMVPHIKDAARSVCFAVGPVDRVTAFDCEDCGQMCYFVRVGCDDLLVMCETSQRELLRIHNHGRIPKSETYDTFKGVKIETVECANPTVLPPTKEEALREAIKTIELNQDRLRDHSIADPACRLYECHQMVLRLLPRLRAALGET